MVHRMVDGVFSGIYNYNLQFAYLMFNTQQMLKQIGKFDETNPIEM